MRREQISRSACRNCIVHAADGFFHDALQRAAPAGVHGSDGAILGVDEQNGHAIGGLNTEQEDWEYAEMEASRIAGFGGRGIENRK